jgi:hypothetical protein
MQSMVDRIHPEDHPAEHWPHDIVEDVGAEALRIPEHLTDGVVAQDREHWPIAEKRGRARLEDREQVALVDGALPPQLGPARIRIDHHAGSVSGLEHVEHIAVVVESTIHDPPSRPERPPDQRISPFAGVGLFAFGIEASVRGSSAGPAAPARWRAN